MSFKSKRILFVLCAVFFVVLVAALVAWIGEVYVDSQVISWRIPGLGDILPHLPGGTRSLRISGRDFHHVLGDKPGFLKIDKLNAVLFVQLHPGESSQCNVFIFGSDKLVPFGSTAALIEYSIGRKPDAIRIISLNESSFQVAFEYLPGEKITYEFN